MSPQPDTAAALESAKHFTGDAQPDPEPAVPSLDAPDPGVFHHEPGNDAQPTGTPESNTKNA